MRPIVVPFLTSCVTLARDLLGRRRILALRPWRSSVGSNWLMFPAARTIASPLSEHPEQGFLPGASEGRSLE